MVNPLPPSPEFNVLEMQEIDTSEFDIGTIGRAQVDQFEATSKAMLAGFAVSPSQAPEFSSQVFSELTLEGRSESLDYILDIDQQGRTELKSRNLRQGLNQSIDQMGTFADIAMQSSARMNALGILDRLNIVENEGVTKRTIGALAFANQASLPPSTSNPNAISIQEQLKTMEDGYTLSPAQFLGGVPGGFDRRYLTNADRDRIIKEESPVDERNSSHWTSQVINFTTSAIVPGPYTARLNGVIDDLFPEFNQGLVDPITTAANIERARARIRSMDEVELREFTGRARETIKRITGYGLESNIGQEGPDDFDDQLAVDIWLTLLGDIGDEITLLDNSEGRANEIINQIVVASDALPLAGALLRRGGRVVNQMYRAGKAYRLAGANRSLARNLMTEMQEARRANPNPDEPTQVERDLQVRLEDLIQQGMPKPPGSGSRINHSITEPFTPDKVPNLSIDRSLNNLTPAELDALKAAELSRAARTVETTGMDIQLQNSEVSHIPGGVVTDTSVGSSVDHGFFFPEYAGAVYDSLVAPNRLLAIEARNLQTGEIRNITREDLDLLRDYDNAAGHPLRDPGLTPLDPQNPIRPQRNAEEFTIRVNETAYVSPEHTLPGELDAARIGVTGWASKFLNKSSLYRKYFANASNIAESEADVVVQSLRGLRETYTNLGPLSMRRANNAINKMDFEGRNMTLEEILDVVDHDVKAARGVVAVRQWADAMYHTTNTAARKELLSWRAQVLSFRDGLNGRTSYVARPVDAREVDYNQYIYNPSTGKAERIDQIEFDQRVAQGWQLYEMRRPEREGKQFFNYAWHRNGGDSPASTVASIPSIVVGRTPGYMPRIYDANYIVGRIIRGTDRYGRSYIGREPLSLHNNIEQANRDETLRRALSPQDAQEELRVFDARELEQLGDEHLVSTSTRNTVDYLEASGQLFTTSRGNLLRPVTEHAFDGARGPLKDILDTMEIAEFKAGSRAITNLVRVMTSRWEKAYVERFGRPNAVTGKLEMPIWGDLPRSHIDARDNKELYDKALTDRDHIQLIAGVDRTRVRQAWANAMVNLSEKMVSRYDPGSLRYRIGDNLIRAKYVDPFTTLRRANFIRNIVWAPFRQLPLQFSSAGLYLSAPGAAKYALRGGLSRDMVALITYNLVKDLPSATDDIAKWAKTLGMNEQEYRVLGEQFERTGFMQAIDSHSYAVGNYNSLSGQFAGASQAFTSVGRVVKNTNDFLRRIGFDVGEKGQQMVGFLVERNRYIQEGKNWADREVFDKLVGDVRARTLNMSRTGSTALNRGSLGFMFQFVQWNMRTLQALIPRTIPIKKVDKLYADTIGKLGDDTFSAQEKWGMFFGQSLFWGVGGWGYANLVEDGAEIISDKTGKPIKLEPVVAETLREGLVGEGMNMLVRDFFNDDSSILFSTGFSPVAGFAGNFPSDQRLDSNPITRMYEGLFLQSQNGLWDLIGPTATTGRAFYDSFKYAFAFMGVPIVGTDGAKLPFDPEKSPDLAIDSILRFMPTYNNYMRGKAAWGIGRMLDNNGSLGVEATKGEAAIRGLIGAQSADERENQELLRNLRGSIRKLDDPDWTETRSAAGAYYNYSKALLRRLQAGEIDEDQAFKLMQEHSGMVNYLMEDPIEQERFWDFVAANVRSDLNENKDMELAQLLTSAVGSGNIPSAARSITTINNMQSLDEDTKTTLVNYLTTYMEQARNGRLSPEQP